METQLARFVTKNRLSETIGLSPETFKKYRLNGTWLEGLHWQRINSRCVVYNLSLVLDWIANRSDVHAHTRAIEAYQASLLSNQTSPAGRKAKTPKSAA